MKSEEGKRNFKYLAGALSASISSNLAYISANCAASEPSALEWEEEHSA